MIGVNHDNQANLVDIIMEAKVNKNQANVTKSIVRNLMSVHLTTDEKIYAGANY